MAFYAKTLENISNIPATDYRQRERNLSECTGSVASAANVYVSAPVTTCQPGSTGSINLPTLAPIQGNEILVNVSDDLDIDPVMGGAVYGQREQDRKVKREIANSNERRRMQSINAGFKSLKTILPHTDGDKLSKAAILQQTAEYILQLESDKLRLLNQNEKLRRAYSECMCTASKHKTLLYETLEKDEGIGSPREEDMEDVRRDAIEVRQQLDKERRLRMLLEDQVRDLEAQIYPEKLRELVNSVSTQQQQQQHRPSKRVDDIGGQMEAEEKGIILPQLKINVASNRQNVVCPNDSTVTTTVLTSPPRLQSPIRYQVHPKLPPLQTAVETVPYAGLCVTVDNTEETLTPTQSQSNNYCGSLPRSRQPLKKRAVELTESDQSAPCKVAKVTTQAPTSKPIQPISSNKPMKMVAVKTPDSQNLPIPKPDPQILYPNPPCVPPTYMNLNPHPNNQAWSEQKTPQVMATPTQTNFHITVASKPQIPSTQYVVQPAIQMVHPPKEMTLNQLNNVSSLSMTLTQLNALSTACTRPNLPSHNAVPATRVQAQYLPLVAMDTVLGRRSERRISSATTDSVVSDEEKHELLEDPQNEDNIPTIKLPAVVGRSRSDPGPALTVENHPDIPCSGSSTATVSVLSSGPGSPPVIRHIDAVATRRNLETIVQAIDHLEQQARRNSQDQQPTEESTNT
uniref:Transcription factor protein n=1 Tax=Ciona intestinalis TaxID=7719 RepID=F6ZWX3_CIOIN|nr:transcription factor protein isoform X1 [Ciona intestinalis]|eukprot:XP_009860814.1 transcription factor protein isoform X1 [Ciona intestinalis]